MLALIASVLCCNDEVEAFCNFKGQQSAVSLSAQHQSSRNVRKQCVTACEGST